MNHPLMTPESAPALNETRAVEDSYSARDNADATKVAADDAVGNRGKGITTDETVVAENTADGDDATAAAAASSRSNENRQAQHVSDMLLAHRYRLSLTTAPRQSNFRVVAIVFYEVEGDEEQKKLSAAGDEKNKAKLLGHRSSPSIGNKKLDDFLLPTLPESNDATTMTSSVADMASSYTASMAPPSITDTTSATTVAIAESTATHRRHHHRRSSRRHLSTKKSSTTSRRSQRSLLSSSPTTTPTVSSSLRRLRRRGSFGSHDSNKNRNRRRHHHHHHHQQQHIAPHRPRRRYVVGTNDEPCHIGGSICAERAALVQLRFIPNLVRVTKIVIVTDAIQEVSPGMLCREFMASHVHIPLDTPVVLGGCSCQCCGLDISGKACEEEGGTDAALAELVGLCWNGIVSYGVDEHDFFVDRTVVGTKQQQPQQQQKHKGVGRAAAAAADGFSAQRMMPRHNFCRVETTVGQLYPYPSPYVRLSAVESKRLGENYAKSKSVSRNLGKIVSPVYENGHDNKEVGGDEGHGDADAGVDTDTVGRGGGGNNDGPPLDLFLESKKKTDQECNDSISTVTTKDSDISSMGIPSQRRNPALSTNNDHPNTMAASPYTSPYQSRSLLAVREGPIHHSKHPMGLKVSNPNGLGRPESPSSTRSPAPATTLSTTPTTASTVVTTTTTTPAVNRPTLLTTATGEMMSERKLRRGHQLLNMAVLASRNDDRTDLHPIRYGAAVLFSDGTTATAYQKKSAEYGCTFDAVGQLAHTIEAKRRSRGGGGGGGGDRFLRGAASGSGSSWKDGGIALTEQQVDMTVPNGEKDDGGDKRKDAESAPLTAGNTPQAQSQRQIHRGGQSSLLGDARGGVADNEGGEHRSADDEAESRDFVRPVLLVQSDQYGIAHAPFAPSRAYLMEHGYGDCHVLVHGVGKGGRREEEGGGRDGTNKSNEEQYGKIDFDDPYLELMEVTVEDLAPRPPKMELGIVVIDNS